MFRRVESRIEKVMAIGALVSDELIVKILKEDFSRLIVMKVLFLTAFQEI
jgi:hypothetical protein